MSDRPQLSVVIPMHNASDTVRGVVESFLAVDGISTEVIVVDDASTDDSVAQVEAIGSDAVTIIRNDVSHGAGAARNLGFTHAKGTYTLFFDADDMIHGDALIESIAALDHSGADVAFHSYRYQRGASTDYDGMNVYDRSVFSEYSGRVGQVMPLTSVPRLLGFSNYPWNKVARTDHYRDRGLVYGHTPVHNDILGHWMTLIHARDIVLLDHPLCTHIVAEGGANLTNRRSAQRLTVFDALDETYSFLEREPAARARYAHFYWDFALRVAGWARGRLDEAHFADFNVRLQEHLLRMNLADYTRIREKRNPELATLILTKAMA